MYCAKLGMFYLKRETEFSLCPERDSIYWVQLSRFQMKTETKSSHQNVVF
jgi:hypothetical protein